MQLRAQLRRTPCQMYRATSASESSGGRLYLYASEKIKIFLHDVIEPLPSDGATRRRFLRAGRGFGHGEHLVRETYCIGRRRRPK